MIYLFHGSDVEKTRTKAFEWVAKARAKEPNLAYVRLTHEEITDASLEDAALSGGLFVKRLLILLDDPFQEEDSANILEEHLPALAVSDNAIVILAPKLAAVKAKKFIAKAKMEYKYDKPAALEDKRGFNGNLVNAFAARSRERLWLEVNRALRAGDAPEMLHGLLHWKARDMRDRKLSLDLINLLQTSRRNGLELSLSLEKFALSI
ncbi:MAG: hypothetical protein G01um101491_298 [Parcubacteria group bacterium Gr01-1014_91]|nr:MAG: hypothetical protein G01um101491_298 [Parcubacteria group bacterium Gr01-1014_91]